MYSIKELASLYDVHTNTLRRHLAASGVDLSNRKGSGNKSRIGYSALVPFFRKYGDRTGQSKSYVTFPPSSPQLLLFAKSH